MPRNNLTGDTYIRNEVKKAWHSAVRDSKSKRGRFSPLPYLEVEFDPQGHLYRKNLYGEWVNVDKEKQHGR